MTPCREDGDRAELPEGVLDLVRGKVRAGQGDGVLGGSVERHVDQVDVLVQVAGAVQLQVQHLQLFGRLLQRVVQHLRERDLVLELAAHSLQPGGLFVTRQRFAQVGLLQHRRVEIALEGRLVVDEGVSRERLRASTEALRLGLALGRRAGGLEAVQGGVNRLGRVVVGKRSVVFGLERDQAGPALGKVGVRLVALDYPVDLLVLARQLGRLAGQIAVELGKKTKTSTVRRFFLLNQQYF